jgi:ABC-2 type transport system permease protein
MNKISLIIWREYLTRVRKKSFIIMTFLGPVLFAALIVVPGWMAQVEDKEVSEIAVVEYDANQQPVPDSLQFFRDVIPDKENIKFTYLNNARLPDILRAFEATEYDFSVAKPYFRRQGNFGRVLLPETPQPGNGSSYFQID